MGDGVGIDDFPGLGVNGQVETDGEVVVQGDAADFDSDAERGACAVTVVQVYCQTVLGCRGIVEAHSRLESNVNS